MNLNNRIATVLTTVVPSHDVDTVLREVTTSIGSAENSLAEQRAFALDPTSTDDVVTIARKTIGETEFALERLREAQNRLQARFEDLAADEEAARAKAKADALQARQKAAREKFNAEYYVMALRISALAREMIAAGLKDELPEIHLGEDARSETPVTGIGFNRRRYWPLPQNPGEEPRRSADPDMGGKLVILPDAPKKEKAA